MASNCILVVEDDADIRELLLEYLASDGFSAFGARDGEVALAKLNEPGFVPALILLDRNMDRMDGSQFLDAIEASPSLAARRYPVVIMSAAGDIEEPRAVGYLNKPFDFDDLLKLVKHHCAKP
jgi:DNA-binding response OmpR family regulator